MDFSTAGDSILASSEDHQVSVCIETKLGRIGEDSDIKPIKFKHILTNGEYHSTCLLNYFKLFSCVLCLH